MKRLIPMMVFLLCFQVAHPQVFIADLNMRDVLNQAIPGIVDVNGIMDTTHVGIAGLDTLQHSIQTAIPVLELQGLQFLDSLRYLKIISSLNGNLTSVSCSDYPPFISELSVNVGGAIDLTQVPPSLRRMDLGYFAFNGAHPTVHIAGATENVTLSLGSVAEFTIDEPAILKVLSWGYQILNELILPEVTIDRLFVYRESISQNMDLSAVITDTVGVHDSFVYGTVIWPLTMRSLVVVDNTITMFGPFPDTLNQIFIQQVDPFCLPLLPDSVNALQFTAAIPQCLPNWPMLLSTFLCVNCPTDLQGNFILCSVLNTNCPGTSPGISGRVFIDLDQDGQFDVGEPGLPQAIVSTQPSGNMTGCDATGFWEMAVPTGSHSITAVSNSSYPYLQSITPSTHTANLPNMGDADTLNDFAATLIPGIEDLRVYFYNEPPRPGFGNRLYLNCENYGTVPMDVELTLVFDAEQTWVGSSITPDQLMSNTATWDLSAIPVGSNVSITVDLLTNVTTELGTLFTQQLTAGPVATDETPDDNAYTTTTPVVGSYDPNDKLIQPTTMSPAAVQAGNNAIEYTIRFQNTGTYLAERVVIVDTLSEDLQWSSFEFKGSSHPCQWYITDGVLHFIHNDILLPDSTSDEPNSHGYVQFTIKPVTDLQQGATVGNIAHIVFDFNEPIVTPEAVFTVDVLAGVDQHTTKGVSVYPNPVADVLNISIPLVASSQYVMRDVLGQEVMRGRLNRHQLDVQELHSGHYTIEVLTNGTRTVSRFVKQ